MAAWPAARRKSDLWRGAVVAATLVSALALATPPILDVLDVSPETLEMAAGLVVIAVGGLRVIGLVGPDEQPQNGPTMWLVPVAYPLLLRPEVLLSALTFGARLQIGPAVVLSLMAVAAGAVIGLVTMRRRRLWLAAVRLMGAGAIVVGVILVIDGLRAV
jgi:small neutral amino acid transporter SnatA (MarC family)